MSNINRFGVQVVNPSTIAGLLQQQNVSSSDLVSTALQIAPDFSTLPAITDGATWKTLNITPIDPESTLLISGNITLCTTGSQGAMFCVFDGISDTPVAVFYQSGLPGVNAISQPFSFYYDVASTDEITFTFTYGNVANGGGSNLTAINGRIPSGTAIQLGDGVNWSTVSIAEIAPGSSAFYDISITGNDGATQSRKTFTIKGTEGFLFNWNPSLTEFDIVPPDSIIHSFNSISLTSATLLAGNSNVLTNSSETTVALPANSDVVEGDIVEVVGLSGGYTISQAANQQIAIGDQASTSGASGSVSCSGSLRNCVTLRLVSIAGGLYFWVSTMPPQGTFTVT